MIRTIQDVLEYVEANDVKFVRLAFCDLFGIQKNISVLADQLQSAFEDGISFDASAIDGFEDIERSDLVLMPDAKTLTILPWRPQQGRVARLFCNVLYPDKTPYVSDCRAYLQAAVKRAQCMGFRCNIGVEFEFYLFLTDDNGAPVYTPHDNGGYLDASPLDKGENLRREICLTLEEMGLYPEISHHEQGPGQHEIDFKHSGVLTAADNFIAFKAVVKAIAARNGLFASFMPKPLEEGSGSGLHINISLFQNEENLLARGVEAEGAGQSFIAGVLNRAAEITLFLNPVSNSYKRLGSFSAPAYVSWSHQNRSQMIRIPAAEGDKKRFELRSPDPAINPYLVFALLLHAGLDGIENNEKLPPSTDSNLYTAEASITNSLRKLPTSLRQALELAAKSEFLHKNLPDPIRSRYLASKQKEYVLCEQALNSFEFDLERYFEKL